jgi:uncharacterized protein YndB with AHSA1/START domain
MFRLERSINIKAPPEKVWTVIQDASRRAEWDARVKSARRTSSGPMGGGSTFDMVYNFFGVEMPMRMEYIAWKPFTHSAVRTTSTSRMNATIAGTWNFLAEADGSTTWTTIVSLKSTARFGCGLIEQISGRYTDRLTVISQRHLKALIEREEGGEQGASTRAR